MAEFTEVMKQRERMCDFFQTEEGLCRINCPFSDKKSGAYDDCNRWVMEHYEEAESIIMKWAEEHPIKTNADKFKEVFGDVKDFDFENCFFLCGDNPCSSCEHKDFWEKEYKEPKGVE